MRELLEILDLDQAKALLNPIRVRLLRELVRPRTCAELAQAIGLTQQRVNFHLKSLRDAGLIRIVKRRKLRNLVEATYQAVAKAVWLSPRLIRDEAPDDEVRDRLSLHNLLVSAEEIQADVGALLSRVTEEEVPSLGLAVDITLRDENERQHFAQDLMEALQPVLAKYQGPSAATESSAVDAAAFKVNVICYPKPSESEA